MPTLDEHKKKYDINKRLLTNELNINKCACYDWIVVVAFYAALHLTEGELSKQDLHTTNHTSRGGLVDSYSGFRMIRSQYKVLYDRSRVARYGPACMSKSKAEYALKCLEDIEKQIAL